MTNIKVQTVVLLDKQQDKQTGFQVVQFVIVLILTWKF
jgi:hypothetical protein